MPPPEREFHASPPPPQNFYECKNNPPPTPLEFPQVLCTAPITSGKNSFGKKVFSSKCKLFKHLAICIAHNYKCSRSIVTSISEDTCKESCSFVKHVLKEKIKW